MNLNRDIGYTVILFLTCLIAGLWFIHGTYGVNVDDSYIYFRYIENLSCDLEVAYNPHDVSFGATSILWLGIMAVFKRLFDVDLLQFVKYFGIVCHALSSCLVFMLCRKQNFNSEIAFIFSFFLAINPFFVSSAVSGLETPLNILVILFVLTRLYRSGSALNFGNGALLGLTFLSRPENLVFIGFFFIVLFWSEYQKHRRFSCLIRSCIKTIAGIAVVAGPWSLYVFIHSGQFIPSTYKGLIHFFAPHYLTGGLQGKLVTAQHVLVDLISKLVIGKFKALLPGFVIFFCALPLIVWDSIREKSGSFMLYLSAYCLLFFGICVFSFPITMWRYLLPMTPLFYISGVFACHWIWNLRLIQMERSWWIRRAVAGFAVLMILISGYYHGIALTTDAKTYRKDVGRLINLKNPKMNLACALWLKNNSAPDEKFAALAIGVVGYFSERYLLDLGGLIDPGVWPVLATGKPEDALRLITDYNIKYFIYEKMKVWGSLPELYPDEFRIATEIQGYEATDSPVQILLFRPNGFSDDELAKTQPLKAAYSKDDAVKSHGVLALPDGTARP